MLKQDVATRLNIVAHGTPSYVCVYDASMSSSNPMTKGQKPITTEAYITRAIRILVSIKIC